MSIPKYQQIKQNLLYEINNGKFLPGDKFYSEAELKRKYLSLRHIFTLSHYEMPFAMCREFNGWACLLYTSTSQTGRGRRPSDGVF